jgi:hypothetical protein
MQVNLNTRKPIDQLQPEDLSFFPIWEFATDEEENEEQDETWIRPVATQVIEPDCYSLSVAARFETISGQSILGCVGVTTANEFEFGDGVLLHNGKYIFVPSSDYFNADEDRKAVASSLQLAESQVFPLKFTLLVNVRDEQLPRKGEFK